MKKKILSTLLVITLVTTMIFSNAVSSFADSKQADNVRQEAQIFQGDTLKKYPTYGMEWTVFGLARDGYIDESTYNAYYKNLCEKVRDSDCVLSRNDTNYTEYSKAVIVLTSLGKDVTDVAGYNLLTKVKDVDHNIEQGVNGPLWALIALKSNSSYLDKENNTQDAIIENTYINYLTEEAQLQNGGWAFGQDKNSASTVSPDVDMTAMVIQSLAPYYKTNSQVQAAVNKGLKWLSNHQQTLGTGGFKSGSVENSESISQVIVALTSLGMDPESNSPQQMEGTSETITFNNGTTTNMVNRLVSAFYLGEGKFSHLCEGSNTSYNGLASFQAYYALVAYNRYINSKNNLYDMNDVTLTAADKNLNYASVTLSSSTYTYDGKVKHPSVTVKYGGVTVPETEYSVNYSEGCVIPGNYSVTINSTGQDFIGSRTLNFVINKKDQTITAYRTTWNKIYGNSSFSLGVKRTGNGSVTYYSSNTKVAKVSSTGRVTITGTGRAYITITAASTSTYNKATKKLTINVAPKKQSIRSSYGSYKAFTVKWNKDSRASGYQVQYAKNYGFTKSKRTLTLTKYSTYSKKVSGLSRKTYYYVKVRSYKNVGTTKLYGSWSTIKKVKTK